LYKTIGVFWSYKVDASFDQFLAHPQTIIIQNAPTWVVQDLLNLFTWKNILNFKEMTTNQFWSYQWWPILLPSYMKFIGGYKHDNGVVFNWCVG